MRRKLARTPGTTAAGEVQDLPRSKAFVLQLSGQSGRKLRPFTGRLEHLASGRRLRFETFGGFRAAVIKLLAAAGHDAQDTEP